MNLINKYQKRLGNLIFYQENLKYSAIEFQTAFEKLAFELSNLGIDSGSVVALKLINNSKFCLNLFALWHLGACVVPLNPKASEHEIKIILDDALPDLIIDEFGNHFLKNISKKFDSECALILYTSGSTGRPKGVPITFNQLDKKIITLQKYINTEDLKNTLCFLPLNFGHGLISNFIFPYFSSKNVFIVDFSDLTFATNFNNFIIENEITFFSSVPSTLRIILKFTKSPLQISNLKRIHCASASFNESLWNEVKKNFNHIPFYNIYGITELVSWVAGETVPKSQYIEGYIGKTWDSNIKIHRKNNKAPFGEIFIKADYQVNSYIRNIDQSSWEDGWFKTGDLGFLDIDGNLFVTGRIDDIINLGGTKIYPIEINQEVLKFKEISQVHTMGIEQHGIVKIIVFIIPSSQDIFDITLLKNQLQKTLPVIKWPHEWIKLDEFPLNERGKISKAKLKEIYLKEKFNLSN